MKYSVYAFDFDLTLADTIDVSIETYAVALSSVGVQFDGDVFHHLKQDIRATFDEIDDGTHDYSAFLKLFEDTAVKRFSTVRLYPDVVENLIRIRSSGAKTALVTNRARNSVDKAMEKYGGTDAFFDCVITGDITTNFKPHPEPILKCLALCGCEKQDLIYIGDALNDFRSATAAGVDFAYIDRTGHVKAKGALKTLSELK